MIRNLKLLRQCFQIIQLNAPPTDDILNIPNLPLFLQQTKSIQDKLVVLSRNEFTYRKKNKIILRKAKLPAFFFSTYGLGIKLIQIHAHAGYITHSAGFKGFSPFIVFFVNSNQGIGVMGQPSLHRIENYPVQQRRPLIEMETMSCINHLCSTLAALSSCQPCQRCSYRCMAVNDIIMTQINDFFNFLYASRLPGLNGLLSKGIS